jgi:hypothetical protein
MFSSGRFIGVERSERVVPTSPLLPPTSSSSSSSSSPPLSNSSIC